MSNGIHNGFSLEIQRHARMRGLKACFRVRVTLELRVPLHSLYMAFIQHLFRSAPSASERKPRCFMRLAENAGLKESEPGRFSACIRLLFWDARALIRYGVQARRM
jgi:hypothetical protein